MTEPDKPQDGSKPQLRGEAAWKAEKERIAARNQQARKAGREQRKSHERRMEEQRRSADRRDAESVRAQFGS